MPLNDVRRVKNPIV